MAVYVDNLQMKTKFFGWWGTWSNLYADTRDELVDFAEAACHLSPNCMFDEGYVTERYVINEKKRLAAIEHGAIAIRHGGPRMMRVLKNKKALGYKEKDL